MSKKGPGRKPKADSQARVQELLGLLRDLDMQHLAHQRSYEKMRNLVQQLLAKEPAHQAIEKDMVRAAAVDRAHAAGHKLTMSKKGGAYTVASKDVANTAAKGSPGTMKSAHQRIVPRGFAQELAELKELTKKLRTPQG